MIYRRIAKSVLQYVQAVKNPHPPIERELFRFADAKDLARWSVFSDGEFGGRTSAALTPCPDSPGAASFSGHFSSVVDGDADTVLQRSGFCGIRTKPGDELYDLDDFDALLLRVRGDGRAYVANMRTEDMMAGGQSHDLYQAFLFARPGVWSDVLIPFDRFLLTWRGRVVEEEVAMNKGRVRAFSVGLAGGGDLQPDGPFQLDLAWIRAPMPRGGAVML